MYELRVTFTDGRVETIESGHDPVAVAAANERVNHNPQVIERIALYDGSGPLETFWARAWENASCQ